MVNSVYQYETYRATHQGKKGGEDQGSIPSSTTPDTGYHMGK